MSVDCIGTQSRRVARALTRYYDRALEPEGILLTQYSLLRVLRRLGSSTAKHLADQVALDKSTISRNVKVLSASGWVRFVETTDGREKSIQLTRSGIAKLESATELWKVAQHEVESLSQEAIAVEGKGSLLEIFSALQSRLN